MLSDSEERGLLGLATSLLLTAVLASTAFVSFVAIYRVTLHPLAKHPGPFLAKITDLHALYHAWKGDRHIESYRCHQLYGGVVRYGPNSLSFNTNTALQTIYGHKANCLKGEFYTVFPANKGAYSTHSEIDRKNHARKRRVLSQAFSDKALKGMEEHILKQIRIFSIQLRSNLEPQDMAVRCDHLTFDVLGDLCYGKSFGMQERSDNRYVSNLLSKAAQVVIIAAALPAIKNWYLDEIFFRDLASTKRLFRKFATTQAVERMKVQTDRKDFFSYLIEAKDPETGAGFPIPELWAESSLLVVAGSDTSSTALAATFAYLLHHPDVLEKLRQEIASVFSGSDIEAIKTGPALSSCSYLRACIDEAMRLSPPIGGILPREVQPGGMVIDGHSLDAGTIVGVSAYAIHHHRDYFPAPFEYRPERWLPESGDGKALELALSAYCPFSLGPRGCIGKGLAYMELMTTVARTVFQFEMKLAEGGSGEGHGGRKGLGWGGESQNEYQLIDTFTSRKEGPLIQFCERKA